MSSVRDAIQRLLTSHDPYPAVVIDRHWNVVARNGSTGLLLTDVAANLLVPPVNTLRLALHPSGLAPRIVNLAEWSAYLLRRLSHQLALTDDAILAELEAEVRGYPDVDGPTTTDANPTERVFVPLRLRHGDGELRFLNMVATFGTVLDVTASELVIEAFYPADAATAEALRAFT
jgi:hypothetical protein